MLRADSHSAAPLESASIDVIAGHVPEPRRPGDVRTAQVSVVVPTRNEAGNVVPLLDRLGPALVGRPAEVIFVDDSDDETPAYVRSSSGRRLHGLSVRLLHREPGDRAGGLSTAVIAGIAAASGEWVVVMDGDLQHPPEVVPRLLEAGASGETSLVVASRHVEGGETEGLSGPARVLVSGGATALAKALFPRRLRGVSDPMSGFFAIRRSALDLAALRPDGFKILMEILARTPKLNPVEVGFVFQDRVSGESKASLAEGMRFARHLIRLSVSRLAPSGRTTRRVVGFGAVGVSGIAVNSAALWLLADDSTLGINYLLGSVLATQVSTTWNFVLIDRVVYAGAKADRLARRYGTFLATSNVLLLARIPLLALLVSGLGVHYLIANIITLLLTFVARFVTSDRLIYRMETQQ